MSEEGRPPFALMSNILSQGFEVLHHFGCIVEKIDVAIQRVVVIDHVTYMADDGAFLARSSWVDTTRTAARVATGNARRGSGAFVEQFIGITRGG